jgi:DNA polymerase
MPKIKLRDVVTLDFETFYSKDYSLTKEEYNTSSYIRDPQFYAQCLGIKDGVKKTVWYPHDEIEYALKKHDVANRPIMCHNTQFDGFIISHHYGIVPPFYLDTLSMSRALHGTLGRNDLDTVSRLYGRGGKVKPQNLKKVKGLRELPENLLIDLAEYMCGDVDECYEIGKIQLEVFPWEELLLIDWTIRAFCDPVIQIDGKLVQEELEDEISGKASKRRALMALESVKGLVDPDAPDIDTAIATVLQSADKFAAALEGLGVDVPMKISPSTEQLTYAFAKNDLAFQELLEHEDDRVVALVEARLATKSTQGETRARRMLELVGKPVPVAYNYCGAHTTRWSGGNKLNFQNFPRQGLNKDGTLDLSTGRLRRSIIAPPGHVLVVCDSAQIEARVNAWLSDQLDVLEVFASGGDIYKRMASQIYGVPVESVTKDQRFIGKIAVLGLGYGMGWKKFQATLAMGTMGPAVFIEDAEAQRIVRMYRKAASKIKEMWERNEDILSQMIMKQEGSYKCLEWDHETIWLPNGLGLHYYALNASYDEERRKYTNFQYRERGKFKKIYGGLATENEVQALSRVIIGDQLLRTKANLEKMPLKRTQVARVVMTTHDELVSCVPKAAAKDTLAMMVESMRTPPRWCKDLPLNAEGGFDVCYSK